MIKVACSVPAWRFEKFGAAFPADWEIVYVPVPYTQAQLAEACKGADFLFVGSMDEVGAEVFAANPQLRLAHVEGVGYNKVDVAAAKKAGIPVCNNRATNNGAVAEHTIGLMLAAMRRTASCNAEILGEGFDVCQKKQRAEGCREIGGKHIGLIGIGAIGKEVAKRLKGWDLRVSYYDAFRPS
ncbi:MAG: NAD(P)-dependent oxidoreductase, partial [Clostridia bacterium]|nr:NAD(P)-dependent oxidoreductase [Clostridia bacterium]